MALDIDVFFVPYTAYCSNLILKDGASSVLIRDILGNSSKVMYDIVGDQKITICHLKICLFGIRIILS